MEISTLMKKALNRTIKTLQSLHHGSVGYQHAHTRVGHAKKAKLPTSLPVNIGQDMAPRASHGVSTFIVAPLLAIR
jgi:hypothetical protein